MPSAPLFYTSQHTLSLLRHKDSVYTKKCIQYGEKDQRMSQDTFISSSEDGLQIATSLWLPENTSSTPLPAIVMGHGIGAVKAAGLGSFARRFTSAGYAAITFDYRHFGESQGNPRNFMSIAKELCDFKDVLAWVRDQPQLFDSARIVVWGSSFGGMHVSALMASDHGLAGGVMQCPCVDALKAGLKLPLVHSLWVMCYAVADLIASFIGLRPIYIKLVNDTSSSRAPAVMPLDGARKGWDMITPPSVKNFPNMITARSILSFPFNRPVFGLRKSVKPLLVVLPTFDNEAPLDSAAAAARLAPLGMSLRVEGGHFDLYHGGPSFETNIEGQLEFLKRILA